MKNLGRTLSKALKLNYSSKPYLVVAVVLFGYWFFREVSLWLFYAEHEWELLTVGDFSHLSELQETIAKIVIENVITQPLLLLLFWIADRLYGQYSKTKNAK